MKKVLQLFYYEVVTIFVSQVRLTKKRTNMMAPFNLQKWINDNRDLLKPPIGNKNLYFDAGDFIVMIVGGPNARKDYHYNESDLFPPKIFGGMN